MEPEKNGNKLNKNENPVQGLLKANNDQFEIGQSIGRFWNGYKWFVYMYFAWYVFKFISCGIQYPFDSFGDFLNKLGLTLAGWIILQIFLTVILAGIWCLVGFMKFKKTNPSTNPQPSKKP